MSDPSAASLPRLFVIGDSISLHYGPYLARFVAGSFAYARKRDEAGGRGALHDPGGVGSSLDYPSGAFGENAGDSGMVLEYLRAAVGLYTSRLGDVVVLNCGLHDLKRHPSILRPQVGLDQYGANLTAIAELMADEPNLLVWVTTTPVHDETHAAQAEGLGFTRYQADVERYNAVATAIMRAAGVPVVDLHAFTLTLGGNALDDLYQDHVHFAERVRVAQAAFLAGWLAGRVG